MKTVEGKNTCKSDPATKLSAFISVFASADLMIIIICTCFRLFSGGCFLLVTLCNCLSVFFFVFLFLFYFLTVQEVL